MIRQISTAFAAAFALSVAALPPGVAVDESGAMTLGGLSAAVNVYDRDWRVSIQGKSSIVPEPSYPVPSAKVYELKGTLKVPDSDGFTIQQWVKEAGPDTATYSMTMKSKEGIRCQAVAYSIALPAHLFDGKTIVVNGRERKVENFREPAYHVKDLEITNGDRRIALKGDFTVVIQDNRKFSVPNFSLRLLFAPPSGLVKETKLEFSVSVTPLAVTPLVLEDASAAKVTGSEMAQLLRRHGTNGGDFTVGSVKFRLGDAKKKAAPCCGSGRGKRPFCRREERRPPGSICCRTRPVPAPLLPSPPFMPTAPFRNSISRPAGSSVRRNRSDGCRTGRWPLRTTRRSTASTFRISRCAPAV
ncbi:MAG: hypothetical protein V8T86_17670 [Victivallis sp.]